jgi:L-lysine exporter family protein LysE/ArgO
MLTERDLAMLQTLINGLILGFIASPSCPSNAEEIRLGTRYHVGYALLVGIGAVTGDLIILVAVLLGLVPLLAIYPLLKTSLWFIGTAVMLYVSWGIFKEAISSKTWKLEDKDLAPTSYFRAFWVGFAITTFNPFTALWWVGLLAPMLDAKQGIIIFSIAVIFGSLAWFMLLAALLYFARKWLTYQFRRWVLIGSGLMVVGYAIYFLRQAVLEILSKD